MTLNVAPTTSIEEDLNWRVAGNVAGVSTVETHQTWPMCIDCTVPPFSSRADLNAWIASHDQEHLVREATMARALFDNAAHDGHRVIELGGSIVMGSRTDEVIQTRLRHIKEGLETPVQRFRDHRRPVNKGILNLLASMAGGHLLEVDEETTKQRRRRGCRKGEARREPVGYTLVRVPQVRWKRQKGDVHYAISIESGYNNFSTLLEGKWPARLQQYQRVRGSRTEEGKRQIAEHMGWYIFCDYLNYMAHEPGFYPVWKFWANKVEVPGLHLALRSVTSRDGLYQLVRGDMALLQFQVQKETPAFPGVKSLKALFRALEAMGYPRLSISDAKEERARWESILQAMSYSLQRAVIAEVDWRPLTKALHFSQAEKSER